MPLQYTTKCLLEREHAGTVNCLAFSPDGAMIASGSTDNRLVIWSLDSAQALHRIVTRSAVLSLLWLDDPAHIVFGTADGTMVTLSFVRDSLLISGFDAHAYAIECLSVNRSNPDVRHLASGASAVVKVWSWDNDEEQWTFIDEVYPPRTNSYTEEEPAYVTSVQWLKGSGSEDNRLLTAYLRRGIVCSAWSPTAVKNLWSIRLPLCGFFSLSPDNCSIAVFNIDRGFEVYEIPSGTPCPPLEASSDSPTMVLPIIYVHDGSMLVGGSTVGKVRLWSADGDLIQTLRNNDTSIIQCLDFYCPDVDEHFMIAAGTADPGRSNVVQIWETQVVDA